MKRTVFRIFTLLIVLAMVFSSVTAFAAGTIWKCAACKNFNEGIFCSNCGAKRTETVQSSTKSLPAVGTYVTFGNYEQDNNRFNGKEPIEWLVLDHDPATQSVLLISRYGLDAGQFHNYGRYQGWEKSSVRSWLSDTFLYDAFSSEEQKHIMTAMLSTPDYSGQDGGADTFDRVFLLSTDEAKQYFKTDRERQIVPTAYAVAQGAFQYNGTNTRYQIDGVGCGYWWLRSPGRDGLSAFVTYGTGEIGTDGNMLNTNTCIRPALWCQL